MNTVAICIPTCNQSAFLAQAVRSALAQTHPCEVWVSDDASTDHTPEVMAELVAEFPHLHAHRQQHNLGIEGNPTWVMKQPPVEFIVRLDSDDVLEPDYVAELLVAMTAHPQAGFAHAAVREINAAGQEQRLRQLARSSGFQNAEASLRASVTGYRVAANICMFRKAALEAVGYYQKLSFAEDWDLAVRLADAGWGNVYVPEVLANYRVWESIDKIRSRRKLAEIEGCRRLFETSLTPAFTRRNWSLAPLISARRRLALHHSISLGVGGLTEPQQEELQAALLRLSDSLALRLKFRWIRTPLAPMFQLPSTLAAGAKAWGKAILYKSQA
jgi:cellulose synthase/poly-beta-1,6-N-acetylglucosamine synthase-like glycosyltransferase